MKYLRDTGINAISQFVYNLLLFAVNVIVAQHLGSRGLGVYKLLLLLQSLTTLIGNFGISRAAIYYLGQRNFGVQRIVNNVFSINLLFSLPTALTVLFLFNLGKDSVFSEIPNPYGIAIACLSPLSLAVLHAGNIFAGLQDFVFYNFARLINIFIRFIIILVSALFGLSVFHLIVALVLGNFVAAVSSWMVIYRRVGIEFKIKIDIFSQLLSYGARSYLYSVMNFANFRLDQYMIATLLDVKALGIYSIAVSITEIIIRIPRVFAIALFPKVAHMENDSESEFTVRLTRYIVVITLSMGFGVALTGLPLIRIIFGNEFINAYPAILIMLPGIFAHNIHIILQNDLSGRGKPEIATYASLFAGVITIAGNLLLTPLWGINGASITTTFSYLLASVFILIIFLKDNERHLSDIFLISRSDVKKLVSTLISFFRSHSV